MARVSLLESLNVSYVKAPGILEQGSAHWLIESLRRLQAPGRFWPFWPTWIRPAPPWPCLWTLTRCNPYLLRCNAGFPGSEITNMVGLLRRSKQQLGCIAELFLYLMLNVSRTFGISGIWGSGISGSHVPRPAYSCSCSCNAAISRTRLNKARATSSSKICFSETTASWCTCFLASHISGSNND